MKPGAWRSDTEHDVAVGRHVPLASDRIPDFMKYLLSPIPLNVLARRVELFPWRRLTIA